MKRNEKNELIFQPFGAPKYMCAECINHGLSLPENKTILETGIYTLGYLETKKGRKIEVHLRKNDSFLIHLVSREAKDYPSSLPVRLFPNGEESFEFKYPNQFFNPYYNCHGNTFADSRFWVNPTGGGADIDNIQILLEDEYKEVDNDQLWNVAVLYANNRKVLHSIKRSGTKIINKYDGYQLEELDDIAQVNTDRYGNGNFKYFIST